MLNILLLIPLVGIIILWFIPQASSLVVSRILSLITISLALGVSLVLLIQFNPMDDSLQFLENIPWLAPLGLTYRLGADGLSLPLIVLNNLLTGLALFRSDEAHHRPRLYFTLILFLNVGVTGAFSAQNLLLFFLFYELELIPLYLLIAIWGGAQRGYAATKFLIYTAVSGILLLAAFLGVAWFSQSTTFDYQSLQHHHLPINVQYLLLIALLIGFGIKMPLVPFHTWLPDAHVEASTPISVLLAGVLLKLGTYGLLRFGLGLFPEPWLALSPFLAGWAVVSVLYGAFTAIAQTDMKKMVAFSSIGHMGYILLAAAAATPLSLLGAVFQMVSHGLISAMLFFLVGVIYQKTGTRDIHSLRGLLNPERGLPIIGSLMILGVMASAGIPGMVGFISEFLIFRGSFPVFPVQTLLAMIGTGLTAVYFLLLVNQTFFGRLTTNLSNVPQARWSERTPGIILAILIVTFGLQPAWLTGWIESSTTALSHVFPISTTTLHS